jgi:hypothetical protein
MKMRKLLSIGILAPLVFSRPSFADTRDFDVVNDTSATIVGMWVSTPNDGYWEPVVPFNSVFPRTSTHVIFYHGGPCRVQLRIQLSDGSWPEWSSGFDLCTISKVKIWYDADEDTYIASSQ